ncbi:PleD family two-component system response regulator [Pleionea sp. CnH1-48]|uniref:response regulator n=1 Tax=Pleionea sp. CnH1-48 TaxID=2954494 RepID=UPI0020972119|nr:response regulator transcription factor [Pleionea sp. CnH1-48]MCO7227451.1 response regulator transcription factor [Pleionea sp. CnH1-48]
MQKVLIVDDDVFTREAHKKFLKDTYNVFCASSAEDALVMMKSAIPDLMLLDVKMDGMDGYELCKVIRATEEWRSLPILFVSGLSNLEEKLKCYDVGGDDFIHKSFHADELLAKIKVLLRTAEDKKELSKKVEDAHSTVMTVISTTSELGKAMQFAEKVIALSSVSQATELFFSVMESYDLDSVACIFHEHEYKYFSPSGYVKPIERELLEVLRNKGRFYHFEQRTQTNFSNVSVLVKNMPVDDDARYGRLKDILPALVGVLGSRISAIEAQDAIISQSQEVIYSFDVIQTTMNTLTASLAKNQEEAAAVLRKMISDLDWFVPKLGLEDDQEQYIIGHIDQAINGALSIMNAGTSIQNSFSEITNSLKATVENQNKIVVDILNEREAHACEEGSTDDDDVELF